jgi:phosphoribosylaminoimidazole carboxylase PurE protein
MAVVGPSAAGKSSLVKLLLGLWAPAAGSVRLDGVELCDWSHDEVGPHVGYVPQEIEFFEGSVAENIARLGPVDSEKVVQAAELIGSTERWQQLVDLALKLYRRGVDHARSRGLILVDTKYEFGLIGETIMLIDEVHTPDSSRYWYAEAYEADPAHPRQLSKEFLREWLRDRGFTGEGPTPVLDDEIRIEVATRYIALYKSLTGQDFVPALENPPGTRIVTALKAAGILRGGVVAIIMGSPSDQAHADKIRRVLDRFGVPSRLHVASAHKVPEKLLGLIDAYNHSSQPIVYITIAGRSNGLSGVTAGSAIHPVIACPPFKDHGDYQVNVHSSLQMPSDTPVVTVLDPANAALAAVRMLGLGDATLLERMRDHLHSVKSSFDEVLHLA